MAVTNGYQPKQYKYTNQQQNGQAGQQIDTRSQQLRGTSEQTRAQQAKYQNAYTPSQSVTDAQSRLQQVMNGKPAGYQSKYGAALDGILQQIQNPEGFKYEFNNDELFKSYADLYTQQGRQASMDTMGQAAGLTGGYGNSYAQNAGNQAYQQYLLSLYDRGMDLYDRAYQRYEGDRADRYNRLNALQSADATDYGRYRDEVGDWESERNYYTDRADTEYDRDYQDYLQNREYWQQQAQMENADWWSANQFNEQQRQNDAARQYQYDALNTENQYRYDTLEENQNQFGANYAENQRQYDTTLAENQRQFDANFGENQRQFDANLAENRRQYDTSMAENQRQFNANLAENQRQFGESMQEQIREFNETSKLDWEKLEQNQKQFDANLTEEQRQYNQNYAYNMCEAIFAQNQIPSNELLVAAGLSLEDAQKMIEQIVEAGGGGGEAASSGGGGGRGGSSNVDGEAYANWQQIQKTADKSKTDSPLNRLMKEATGMGIEEYAKATQETTKAPQYETAEEAATEEKKKKLPGYNALLR